MWLDVESAQVELEQELVKEKAKLFQQLEHLDRNHANTNMNRKVC